jgi:hypothetical protein
MSFQCARKFYYYGRPMEDCGIILRRRIAVPEAAEAVAAVLLISAEQLRMGGRNMVRELCSIQQRRSMSFVKQWKAVFHHSWQSLSSLVKLQGREVRGGLKGRAGAIFGAVAVGDLLLAFVGCGGL